MFEEETRRALEYVGRGMSVRIVGAAGSGRSTVAKAIVAELEKRGTEIYSVFGTRFLRQSPLAGIASLGLDLRARVNGPLGMADVLAEQLSQRGPRVIVVDDIDLLDNESQAVIDIAQKRSQRPLVMTMGDSPLQNPMSSPERWPEAKIRLSPLRYDQVSKLVTQTLAAPPDVDTTAHILMKSAGNPRLVVRMAQSAVLNKLLLLNEGQWAMAGQTLWNEDLQGTIEALLQGLTSQELDALQAMAVVGTKPIRDLEPIVDTLMLDRLERYGLVAVSEDVDGQICAAVNPPLLIDYFREGNTLSQRRILASRIERVAAQTPLAVTATSQMSAPVAAVVGQLHEDAGASGALNALHFQEQLREREDAHFALWQADPSMANAAAFLKFYWGGAIDPSRIELILQGSVMEEDADPEDCLFFTMTWALWAIVRGDDIQVTVDMLTELGRNYPDWKAEAEGFALFLTASYEQMPRNLDDILKKLGEGNADTGVLAVIRALLEIYRFDGLAALKALDSASGFTLAAGIEPFVRGLALLTAGKVDEALIFSLKQRWTARRSLDQFGFVANSYVATMALTQLGFTAEAEQLMSTVFTLGRPGFLVSSLHDAMLRLAGLRALTGPGKITATLGSQARSDVRDIGPLPGIGKGVFDLFAGSYSEPLAFDEKATRLIDAQLNHGYLLEAAYTSVFVLCLLPSRSVLERGRNIYRSRGVTSHEQFFSIAEAVADNDYQELRVLLEKYEPDVDQHAVGLLLKGAVKRRSLERGKGSSSTLQQLSHAFDARFPTHGHCLSLNVGAEQSQPLSSRETEIAILAGSQTNTEISARLRISLRTVENHISRALKKTGTTSRRALYEHVRGKRS